MIQVLATNITSPLGFTTEENYQAVRAGRSALRRYDGQWALPEPFAASLFTEAQWQALPHDGGSRFEQLALASAREALRRTSFDVSSARVVFLLSTTKGNVECLAEADASYTPATSARRIARALGLTTAPVVVCNACVSGLAAQQLALRLLETGGYDYAIVTGAEVQSPFIVTGFQSLKAVSAAPCRPFDIERLGLNLGEAAATVVYGAGATATPSWHLLNAALRNDAYHISTPSPQGEGYARAIEATLAGFDGHRLAAVGVHGTATMYNDQMESKGIQRAGLSSVPLSALKGYYGHTMGAAGVLESILMMQAVGDGQLPPSRGYEERGVSGKVTLSSQPLTVTKHAFLKMLSGFGGCNGAALFDFCEPQLIAARLAPTYEAVAQVVLTPRTATYGGQRLPVGEATGRALLTALYKQCAGDYPRFYKMDTLSRLAFLAAELLLKPADLHDTDRCAVVFFNHTSSLLTDQRYQQTIAHADDFFPSPSLFVYTLPNITTGEVALRHHLYGETSFYILPEKDPAQISILLQATFSSRPTHFVLAGWLESTSDDDFYADCSLYQTLTSQ